MTKTTNRRFVIIIGLCALGFGVFLAVKGTNSDSVPILWRADVDYLDPQSPLILAPEGGLCASTYSEILQFDHLGNALMKMTENLVRLKNFRAIGMSAHGTLYCTVYIGDGLSSLQARGPDGSLLWETIGMEVFRSAPPITAPDGTMYVNSSSNLVAVSASGRLRWSFKADAALYCPVALGPDGSIYLISTDHLYCINPDGSLKWESRGSGWFGTPAIAKDGTIYLRASTNHTLVSMKPDRTLNWTYSSGRHALNGPVLGPAGAIHVITAGNWLDTLNRDGSLMWSLQLGNYYSMQAPAVAADGTLFVASGDPKVTAISPNGDVEWKFMIPRNGSLRIPRTWRETRNILMERFGMRKSIQMSRPLLSPDGTLFVGVGMQGGSIFALSTGKKPFVEWTP